MPMRARMQSCPALSDWPPHRSCAAASQLHALPRMTPLPISLLGLPSLCTPNPTSHLGVYHPEACSGIAGFVSLLGRQGSCLEAAGLRPEHLQGRLHDLCLQHDAQHAQALVQRGQAVGTGLAAAQVRSGGERERGRVCVCVCVRPGLLQQDQAVGTGLAAAQVWGLPGNPPESG